MKELSDEKTAIMFYQAIVSIRNITFYDFFLEYVFNFDLFW